MDLVSAMQGFHLRRRLQHRQVLRFRLGLPDRNGARRPALRGVLADLACSNTQRVVLYQRYSRIDPCQPTLAARMIRRNVAEAIAWLTEAFGFDHLGKSHRLYQYSADSRMVGNPEVRTGPSLSSKWPVIRPDPPIGWLHE